MKVDIVIVNWNSGSLLFDCVDSIVSFGAGVVGKIIVVDNASTDNSYKFLRNSESVTLIQANSNLGFGKACNLGAAYCDEEFVLFLNPDARIFDDTLESVLSFIQNPRNCRVGICGIQLEDESGEIARSSSRFPTAGRLFCQSLGLNKIFPTLGMPMLEWNHGETRLVDQVIGAFFFVRRSLFVQLSGFDERFFVYFEEVDFSYRAKKIGWDSAFYAETRSFHVGGGISRQIKAKRLFYSLRSRLQFAVKHFNSLGLAVVVVSTLFIEPFTRMAPLMFRHSSQSIKENFLAFQLLYGWILKKI